MIDKNMLKIVMVEHGDTQSDLSEALGVSLSRLNAKLNGYKGAQFTMSEMGAIRERYNLSSEEFDLIFYPLTK